MIRHVTFGYLIHDELLLFQSGVGVGDKEETRDWGRVRKDRKRLPKLKTLTCH